MDLARDWHEYLVDVSHRNGQALAARDDVLGNGSGRIPACPHDFSNGGVIWSVIFSPREVDFHGSGYCLPCFFDLWRDVLLIQRSRHSKNAHEFVEYRPIGVSADIRFRKRRQSAQWAYHGSKVTFCCGPREVSRLSMLSDDGLMQTLMPSLISRLPSL